MAKLTFRYWAMWAWKSLEIITVWYNYTIRWMKILVFNHNMDTRFWTWKVASRTKLSIPSVGYDELFKFKEYVYHALSKSKELIECILIDEAQFLTPFQVDELADIATFFDIPVLCYWLRTDYKTNLFPWAKRLMEIATTIEEIKTVCWCWKKATINCKILDGNIIMSDFQSANGDIVTKKSNIDIGGDEKYVSLCYKHYKTHNLWSNAKK